MLKFTTLADFKAHTENRTRKEYKELDQQEPLTLVFNTFKELNNHVHSYTAAALEKAIADLGPKWFCLAIPNISVVTIACNFENAEEALPGKLAAERRLKRTVGQMYHIEFHQ